MATTRGLERLIFFTDAIAAIAITLLILPLVDAVGAAPADTSLGGYLAEQWPRVLAFMISFAVISRLWLSHHALFEHVRSYDRVLMSLTLLWAFTIVLLPLPTAMTAAFDAQPATVAFYIGTMTLSSLSITLIAYYVHRSAALEDQENRISRATLRVSTSISIGFAVALIVGTAVPAVNYWALFVLFLLPPIGVIQRRRALSRATSSAPG